MCVTTNQTEFEPGKKMNNLPCVHPAVEPQFMHVVQ